MEGGVERPDVREVGIARPDQGPVEQLERCLVVVEELCPVLIVDAVDVDRAQGEADVDNDEDEEEDKDVNNHVAHGDDDRPDRSVHQPSLYAAEEGEEGGHGPETLPYEGHFVPLIGTLPTPALVALVGQEPEDQGDQEGQVGDEYDDVSEGEPTTHGLGPSFSLFTKSVNGSKVL